MEGDNHPRVIYTLRHAAIDFSKRRIIAGHLNPPLSREGRDQVIEMADSAPRIRYEQVISSPLLRALDTARRVTGWADNRIQLCDLCMERNYGQMQGIAPERIRDLRPAPHYVKVGGIDHSLNPPGGETLEALRRRAERFHRLVGESAAQALLIVSHGTFLQQYHGHLLGRDVYHALDANVACLELNEFRFRGPALASHRRLYRPRSGEEFW